MPARCKVSSSRGGLKQNATGGDGSRPHRRVKWSSSKAGRRIRGGARRRRNMATRGTTIEATRSGDSAAVQAGPEAPDQDRGDVQRRLNGGTGGLRPRRFQTKGSSAMRRAGAGGSPDEARYRLSMVAAAQSRRFAARVTVSQKQVNQRSWWSKPIAGRGVSGQGRTRATPVGGEVRP